MEDAPLTYWDFAENDRTFFRKAYDNGIKGSVLVSLGRDICERYLKHIVSEYDGAYTGAEQNIRDNALRNNCLLLLVKYIHEYMEMDIPQELEYAVEQIEKFDNWTRYPHIGSRLPSEEDIDKANVAVELTRRFVLEACGKKKEGKG